MAARNDPSTRWSVARDALAILLTGIACGCAFNALERSSSPPRGLPWVTHVTALESVEATLPPPTGVRPPEPRPAPPAVAPRPEARGAAATRRASVTTVRESVATTADTQALASDPPLRARGFAPALPVIPDVGRPLRVELSTVSLLQAADAALVVDAREPEEYTAGHIAGAVSLPYDDAMREPARAAALDVRGRPVIVYCNGGTCESSRDLAELLVRDHGLRRVLVYEGGYPEWAAAGKPVQQGQP